MTRPPAWFERLLAGPVDVIGVGVAVLLTLVLLCGVVAPLAQRGVRNAARAADAARQKQRANGIAAAVRGARQEIDRKRADLDHASVRVGPPALINARLSALVALAGECGVTVQDLKPGEAAAARRYVVTPVRVSGVGTYPDCTRLLRRLKATLPDFVVGGFRLTADNAAAKCELDLRWFAVGEAKSPAAAMAATPGD